MPNEGATQRRHAKRKRARTPTVLQIEAVECGAAALGSVLGFYRLFVPLEQLRSQCGVSRDGSKASQMLKAARSYGMNAQGFRMEPSGLREIPLPAILHWNFNHYVVLEGFDKQRVYINDPATGPRTVSAQALDDSFTGVVITLAPTAQFQPGGRKPSAIHDLKQRLKGAQAALAFVFLASLLLVIPGLLLPIFAQIFVDYYLARGYTRWIAPLLIGMTLTAIIRAILTWLQRHYLLRLETRMDVVSSSRLLGRILRLPIDFFYQRSAGDLNARIGSNVRVARLLSGDLPIALLNILLRGF